MGHPMSIHSKNEEVILQFGLKKPAFRICVNTSTTHGSIGLTTGLDPAMTLGCGGWGGNITSDNISPRHLLNIKRLAYEVRPAGQPVGEITQVLAQAQQGIPFQALSRKIDAFLASRGFRPTEDRPSPSPEPANGKAAAADNPEDFICEDDVREAVRAGRKLLVGEKTIVTPSARELGDSQKVFVQAGWPH